MKTISINDALLIIIIPVSLPEIPFTENISGGIGYLAEHIFPQPRISKADIIPSGGTVNSQSYSCFIAGKRTGKRTVGDAVDLFNGAVSQIERIGHMSGVSEITDQKVRHGIPIGIDTSDQFVYCCGFNEGKFFVAIAVFVCKFDRGIGKPSLQGRGKVPLPHNGGVARQIAESKIQHAGGIFLTVQFGSDHFKVDTEAGCIGGDNRIKSGHPEVFRSTKTGVDHQNRKFCRDGIFDHISERIIRKNIPFKEIMQIDNGRRIDRQSDRIQIDG